MRVSTFFRLEAKMDKCPKCGKVHDLGKACPPKQDNQEAVQGKEAQKGGERKHQMPQQAREGNW